MNIVDYPITLEDNNPNRNTGGRVVRESTQREWKEHSKYKVSSESFCIDTAKLWNEADPSIKAAETLESAKRLIIFFVKLFNSKIISHRYFSF